jgi:hypothetical protein
MACCSRLPPRRSPRSPPIRPSIIAAAVSAESP